MARQARGTVIFEIEPLGRGLKPEHVDDLIEQLGQRDAVAFDAQRSILDPRDVEQTVDQVDEVARTAPDDLDRVFDMLGRVALDQLRIARNDVERRPYFMADPDDIAALGEVGGFGHLLGALQLDIGLAVRSEEHTSELQSLMRISYAVFCLTKKTHPKYIV